LFPTVKTEDNSKISVQGVDYKISQGAREDLNSEELVQSDRNMNLTTNHYLVPKLRKTPP